MSRQKGYGITNPQKKLLAALCKQANLQWHQSFNRLSKRHAALLIAWLLRKASTKEQS